MQLVSAFKFLQFLILCVFVILISDFRRKKGMVGLVREGWTRALKVSYLVPFTMYLHVLYSLKQISVFDAPAVGLTLLGTALVGKAKLDLSSCHTWTGYCSTAARPITNGIYAYIRHPIYTGIFVVISGSLFTIVPRVDLSVSRALPVAALISVCYTMGFLAFLASRETLTMLTNHGAAFRHYIENVHAFLPLRKYPAGTAC